MSNTPASDPVARAEAAYLGLALGDALGATVEFMTPREIRAAFIHKRGLHREMTGGGWLKLKPGQVTDDTTMALALGQAILADGGAVHPLSCARAFDDWMRGKPVDIGNTVRRNLIAFRKTGDPCAPFSEHDAGNGAAMRVLPVALATLGQDEASVRQALLDTGSFEDCVVDVVNRGGDADTTGAIAGMLAGALYGRDALPRRWLRTLDPSVRESCAAQARALLEVRRLPA